MSRLRARYQNSVTDPEMWLLSITEYWTECRRFDPNAIRRAFAVAHRKHPQWMPSLGQFLELIEGSPEDGAKLAWDEVKRLASRSSSEHSDPIARRAIQLMGGGKRLGQMKTEELDVWGRKQFEEMYDLASREKIEERASLPEMDTRVAGLVKGITQSKSIASR